jgi:peptidoglycan/LPS O-acetylase OafA/YrhL
MQVPKRTHPIVPDHIKLGYVPALNGLRGVAILLVIGNHLPLDEFELPGGFVGVNLFFVLSGFLITTLLLQEFNQTGSVSLKNFYIRRALRLGPALIVMLTVMCALSFVLFDRAHALKNCGYALIALFYSSNWVKALTQNGLGMVAQTWSLSVEEQFYFIWPFLLLTTARVAKKSRYLIALAAVLALFSWADGIILAMKGATFTRIYFGLDSTADTLMVGCILGVVLTSCRVTEDTKRIMEKFLVVLAPLSLMCLVAFAARGNILGKGLYYYGFIAIALMAAALILDVMVSRQSVLKRLLEMKWLVWLGSVSYGLYLWHWPIIYLMTDGYRRNLWTAIVVGLPLAFLATVLSYYYMEKPILAFKKRFA